MWCGTRELSPGLAEKNVIRDSRGVGLSIGHRDTDNLIRENEISGSGKVGILFRPERGQSFAPHRNRLEHNRLTDNAPEGGAAIDVARLPRTVLRPGSQDELFVVKDGKAEVRHVDFVPTSDGSILVRSGVTADEDVLLSPAAETKDGQVVIVRAAGKTAPAPEAKVQTEPAAGAAAGSKP